MVERQRRWPEALFRRLTTLYLSEFFPLTHFLLRQKIQILQDTWLTLQSLGRWLAPLQAIDGCGWTTSKAEAKHLAVRLPGEEQQLRRLGYVSSTYCGAVGRVFPRLSGSCSQSAAVQPEWWQQHHLLLTGGVPDGGSCLPVRNPLVSSLLDPSGGLPRCISLTR